MTEASYTAEEIKSADPKRCWVDGVKNVSDKHHIRPVEYGGPEDGLTVPLCPTCHRNVHREADSRYKGNEAGAYVNEENYPENQELSKASFLAGYVLTSRRIFENSGEEKAEGARHMMQVSFERDELAMAHDLKRSLGFKALDRMVKYVILEAWKQQKKKGK